MLYTNNKEKQYFQLYSENRGYYTKLKKCVKKQQWMRGVGSGKEGKGSGKAGEAVQPMVASHGLLLPVHPPIIGNAGVNANTRAKSITMPMMTIIMHHSLNVCVLIFHPHKVLELAANTNHSRLCC